MDYIVRATAAGGQIRAFAATARGLAEKARALHNTSPVATAALGRLLTAGAMMGVMMKGDKDIPVSYTHLDVYKRQQQQMVELTKAISVKSSVLIMDEPTSSLTRKEIDNLFRITRKLKEEGTSILLSLIHI